MVHGRKFTPPLCSPSSNSTTRQQLSGNEGRMILLGVRDGFSLICQAIKHTAKSPLSGYVLSSLTLAPGITLFAQVVPASARRAVNFMASSFSVWPLRTVSTWGYTGRAGFLVARRYHWPFSAAAVTIRSSDCGCAFCGKRVLAVALPRGVVNRCTFNGLLRDFRGPRIFAVSSFFRSDFKWPICRPNIISALGFRRTF